MADVKISALTAVVTPALTDTLPVVQGGVTKKETLTQVRAALMPVVLGTDTSGSLALSGDASGTTAAVVNDIARGLKSATTTVSVSAATAPTNGQVLTATAGTTATWQTPSAGAVGGANTQVLFNDAGTEAGDAGLTYAKATDVLSVVGAVAVGGTVGTTGALRVDSGFSLVSSVGGTDRVLFATNTGADVLVGNASNSGDCIFRTPSGTVYMQAGGSNYVTCGASVVTCGYPIIGNSGGSSPYSVHGTGIQAMADANQTPSASVYKYNTIRTTGAVTAIRDLVMPAVTDAASYEFTLENTCTYSGGANDVSIRVKDSGAGTVTFVPAGHTARIRMNANGASRVGALYDVGAGMGTLAITGAAVLTQEMWEKTVWTFTGSTAGTSDITLPLPTVGQAYVKHVRNDTTAGTLKFKCSSGTTKTLAVGPNLAVLMVTSDGVVGGTLT
jgi:hypothetical protein